MEQEKIQIFEEYVMNREDFKFKTKEFNQDREYLRILEKIKKMDTIDAQVQKDVKKFCQSHQVDEELKQNIKTQIFLKVFDLGDDTEKKEMIQNFNSMFLKCDFDFQKPNDLKYREDLDTDSQAEKVDSYLTDKFKEQMTLQYQLDMLYNKKTQSILQQIPTQYLHNIDLSKFDIIDDKELIKNILQNIPKHKILEVKDFVEFLKKYMQSFPNDNFLQNNIYDKLSYTQMLSLRTDDQLKQDHYFFNKHLQKQIDLNDYYKKTEQEKLQYIQQIEDIIKDNQMEKYYINCFNEFQLEKLYLSLKLGDCDVLNKSQEYILRYWKKENNQEKQAKTIQYSISILNNIDNTQKEERFQLIKEKLFDKFDIDYIIDTYQIQESQQYQLKNEYYKYQLLQDKKQEEAQKFLQKQQYQEYKDQQMLKVETTKKKYENDEKVEIKLIIKNINKVLVKIYEIDAWTYLQNNLNENFINIDVTGFLAQKNYDLQFQENPFKKHDKFLSLEYIQNIKRGYFLVDIQGSILTSRALIVKGQYQIIQNQNNDRLLQILDEEFQVCKGKDTKIWIDKQFFEANEQTGEILIPEKIDSFNGKIILCHDQHYQLADINIKNLNQYSFDFTCYFNPESIQDNEKLKIDLDLNFYQNHKIQPLQNIQDLLIVVNTYTLDNTDNQITFKDIELKDNQSINLEFLAPNELKEIKILTSFRIDFKGEKKDFSQTKYIRLDRRNHSQDILQIYLNQNDNKEYMIKCLGKNGEKLSGVYLDFEFDHKFSTQSQNVKLVSDKQGEISLGVLQNIENFRVLQNSNLIKQFYLEQDHIITYQKEMIFFKSDTIQLPIQENSSIQLNKIDDLQQSIENLNNKFQIENCILKIQELDQGNYQLQINETIIYLKIVDAQIVNDQYNIAKTKKNFIQKGLTSNYLQTTLKKENDKINFKINSDGGSQYKVFLSQSNFMNYDNQQVIDQYGQKNVQYIHQQNRTQQQVYKQSVQLFENQYINDKDLSRELIYCQQRKNQNKMIGNTLQNPSLLTLKEKQFEANEQKEGFNDEARGNPFSRQIKKLLKQKNKKGLSRLYQTNHLTKPHPQYSEFLVTDFLSQRGVLRQIKVDKNNEFSIQQDTLNKFGQNKIIIYHQGLINVINQNQEFKNIALKDLRLKESQKEHHILQSIRQIQFIKKDEQVTIKDLKNTQFYHIATQKQLFRTFRLLNNQTDLVQWTFLLQWNNKNIEDKMKFYQKYACTEFNLFLYFKDREFFKNILQEFIQQKIEKKLVDYYLLDDIKSLKRYCCVSQIPNLKKIELVLLYHKMNKIKPDYCKKLYNYMKQNSQRINISDKIKNTVIDNIILSKDKKQNQSDLQAALNELNDLYKKLKYIQQKPQKRIRANYGFGNIGYGEDDDECEEELMEEECSYEDCAPVYAKMEQKQQDFSYQQRKDYLALSCDFNDDCEQFSDVSLPKQTGSTNQYIEQKNKYQWSDSNLIENIWFQILNHINSTQSFDNFFDESFVYSCSNVADMIFFMSIIDIDFKNETKIDKQEEVLNITQQYNSICISKQIKEVKGTQKQSNVSIIQRFFDPQDQTYYDEESDETFDKEVKYFEKLKRYGSKLIITNFSNKKYSLSLNYQIPQGSIPLLQLSHTRVQNIQIDSFSTQIITFFFYFPDYGSFSVFPALLYKGKQLMASAQIEKQIEVKIKEKKQDFQTVNDILQSGDINTILQFIQQKNVMNSKILQLQNFYWLLKKKEFYEKLKNILEEKGVYDNTIWSFSIFHQDLQGFKQYLQYEENLQFFKEYVYLKCDFIEINNFQIVEFYPLITARCHQFMEGESTIRNIKFLETYQKFLEYMINRQDITHTDNMMLTNYLIAQNRYQEARKVFKKVSREDVTCQLQYDYIDAYLRFILDFPNFEEVKEICESYIDYEFIEWKNLFIEMLNQISEYEDKELIKKDLNQTKQKTEGKKVETQKEFECKLDNKKLIITLQQTDILTISFYQVEYEVLFSADPFTKNQNLNQNYCKPYKTIRQKFEVDNAFFKQFEVTFEDIQNQNLIIQIQNDQNYKKNIIYIPCQFVVLVNEEETQIRVFDPIKQIPLSQVYVKTFILNKSNQVQFYKDGYTDIRGSFDYGKLNVNNLSNIQKFAILILSDEYGCKVQYVEGKQQQKQEFVAVNKMRGNYKAKKRAFKKKY